jgi:hypothetical protein
LIYLLSFFILFVLLIIFLYSLCSTYYSYCSYFFDEQEFESHFLNGQSKAFGQKVAIKEKYTQIRIIAIQLQNGGVSGVHQDNDIIFTQTTKIKILSTKATYFIIIKLFYIYFIKI